MLVCRRVNASWEGRCAVNLSHVTSCLASCRPTSSSHISTIAIMTPPHPAGDSNKLKFNWVSLYLYLSSSTSFTCLTAANISANMQDFLDIVASRGAYLHTCPPTPIHRKQNVGEFATALTSGLNRLLFGQEIRRRKYGDAADEWPPGHTPTELVEKRAAELKALITFMEASSPSDCSDDEQNYLEKKRKSQHNTDSNHRADRPPQPRLPTPSPSNLEGTPNSAPSCHESPLLMSDKVASETKRGTKRRLDDTEEEGQHKKSRIVALEAERPRRSVRLRRGTG